MKKLILALTVGSVFAAEPAFIGTSTPSPNTSVEQQVNPVEISHEDQQRVDALLGSFRSGVQSIIEENADSLALEEDNTQKKILLEHKLRELIIQGINNLVSFVEDKSPIIERETKRIINQLDQVIQEKKVERETKRIADQAKRAYERTAPRVEKEAKRFGKKLGF